MAANIQHPQRFANGNPPMMKPYGAPSDPAGDFSHLASPYPQQTNPVSMGPQGDSQGNHMPIMGDASSMQQQIMYHPGGYVLQPMPGGMPGMMMAAGMPGQPGVQGPGMPPAGMQFVVVQQPGPGGMQQQMQQQMQQPAPGVPQQMQQPGMQGMQVAMPDGAGHMVMMAAPQGMPGQDLGKGAMQGAPVDGMQDGKGAAARVAALSRSQQPKQGTSWRGADKQVGKANSEQQMAGAQQLGNQPLESTPQGQTDGATGGEDSKLGYQMRKPQGKHWADFDTYSDQQDLKTLSQEWSKSTGHDLSQIPATSHGGDNRKDGKGKAGAGMEESSKSGGKGSQQQRQDSHAAEKQWQPVRHNEQPLKGNRKGQGRQDAATWQPVATPKPAVPAPAQSQTVAAAQQLAAKSGRNASPAVANPASLASAGTSGGGGSGGGGGGKKSKSKVDKGLEDWCAARMAGSQAAPSAADAAASLARGAEMDYDEAEGDDYGDIQESRSRGKRKGGKGAKSGSGKAATEEKRRDKGKGKGSGKGGRGRGGGYQWRTSG